MKSRTSMDVICSYMTNEIRASLDRCDKSNFKDLTELRMYNGRGIAFVYREDIRFLERSGSLSRQFNDSCIRVNSETLRDVLARLSRFSVYCHEKELSDGCFVLENGVRAGMSGRFTSGVQPVLKDISSINYRIARQVPGCGEEIFNRTFGRSVLICGAVNSGKTTLLRDLCREYGNIMKCTLIDERNEVAAMQSGRPDNDVGLLTDIITGKSRHDGIISAVRTLSPQFIFCDEIADSGDAAAIREGVGCGVKFIATIHAESEDELYKRKPVRELLELCAFEIAVFLGVNGKVREIRSLKNVHQDSRCDTFSDKRRTMGIIQSSRI